MTAEHSILAGWASTDITPRAGGHPLGTLPCWMGGYAARTSPATAIHDPLCVYALALGTTAAPLILLLCDLVAVDSALVVQVRQRVLRTLPAATVWLSATHTHSGPECASSVAFSPEPPDPAVLQGVLTAAVQAATSAIAHMHPVRLAWVSGPINGVATNRDHPDDGEPLSLDLLCCYELIPDPPVRPSAIFGSFPCHPTVLSADNLALSADLPGAFRRYLGSVLGLVGSPPLQDPAADQGVGSPPLRGPAASGNEIWIALATGAAGDISTRHMRQGQGFPELDRLGALLAQQAYHYITRQTPQLLPIASPIVRQQHINLTLKPMQPSEFLLEQQRSVASQLDDALQAGNTAQARTLETTLQGLHALQNMAHRQHETHAEISVADLGALTLVAIPGELYHSLGLAIQHAATHVLILGYTNGYIGYLPTHAAYASLDYEVLISPFAAGSGEQVRDTAIGLL
ncbi:MAG TPA: hypothetical protein VKR06_19155 [Ktedonosporobacter sp.]|nr:hypothetical protein [Ktedonosporobacter sp.]